MVDQIAVVTFTTPATTGTLDVTDPSITEAFSAAIILYSQFTGDSTDNANGMLGVGFIGVNGLDTDSTRSFFTAFQCENGVASGQDVNTMRALNIVIRASAGTNIGPATIEAVYDSSVSGGFRLNFTTASAQTKATAIIFAGLTKAATGAASFTTVGGHESVGTGVDPFEPDLVIFRPSDDLLNTDSAGGVGGTMALGFATNTSPIQQVCAYVNVDELVDPTDADGYVSSDHCSVALNSTSRVTQRISITSFDSTGFNGIADTGTPQANYLALKFSGAVTIGAVNESVAASTGSQSFTGLGFTPDLVFGISTLMTSLDTLTDGPTASCAGEFVTGVYGDRAYTAHNEEGLNIGGAVVTSAHTRHEDAGVLTYEHQGSVSQRGTWNGGVSGGFAINFSVADDAGYLTLLGIQLEQTPLVAPSESVFISDGAVLLLSETLVGDTEGVSVADSAVLLGVDVAITGPDAVNRRRGSTAQGGPLRGKTEGGGPLFGSTS